MRTIHEPLSLPWIHVVLSRLSDPAGASCGYFYFKCWRELLAGAVTFALLRVMAPFLNVTESTAR